MMVLDLPFLIFDVMRCYVIVKFKYKSILLWCDHSSIDVIWCIILHTHTHIQTPSNLNNPSSIYMIWWAVIYVWCIFSSLTSLNSSSPLYFALLYFALLCFLFSFLLSVILFIYVMGKRRWRTTRERWDQRYWRKRWCCDGVEVSFEKKEKKK